MFAQNTEFILSGININIDALFEQVFNRSPKLTYIYKQGSAKIHYQEAFLGLMQHSNRMTIEYELPYKGFKLSDVIDDTGDLDIINFLTKYKHTYKAYPINLPIATHNTDRIWDIISQNQKLIYDEFQGLDTFRCSYLPNRHITIVFDYRYDPVQIYNMEAASQNEAERLVKYLYGKGNIPQFLKVFLAFSYIQQSVKYDTTYIESMKRGLKNLDISPELPFCVLGSASKRAISKGISEAFKLIMGRSGIECLIVRGKLNVPGGEDEYYWNMVKLNGMYYHVDVSWYVNNKGINVSRFMCNDRIFFNEHAWYEGTPDAKGCTFNYDHVEEYVNENINKLTASGIEKKYLIPDEIYD